MTIDRRTVIKAGVSLAALGASWTPARALSKGGVLNIGTNREMNYNMLSFAMTGDSLDYVYSWPIYESLFRPNAGGTVDPWLLSACEADPETMTYTLHVRPQVVFSDGSALDAKVVKWNLDHYMKVGAKRQALLGAIASIEAVDAMTVKIQLSEWSSIIPTALSRECGYMFSQLQYETYGDEYCREHPVGTGPFVLQSWERNVSKVFVRNEKFWNGPVELDGVTYVIYNDALVGQAAMISGEIDAFAGMAYTGIKALADRGFQVAIEPLLDHCSLLVFDSVDPNSDDPTGKLLVRQAIGHAIDVEQIVKTAYLGLAKPATQFGIGTHYLNPNLNGSRYDVAKAKALLAEAGYPDGFSTVLKTQADTASATVLQIVQANLAQVGIKARVEILSGAAANQAATGWGSGMWYQTSSVYVNVGMQMASMFRKGLSGNVLGLTTMLRPDDVDAALGRSVASHSETEAVEAVKRANALLVDTYALFVPIAEYPYPYVVNKKVKNSGIGSEFYSIATLAKAAID